MKITKRDVTFFVLGLFTFFLIDVLTNWDESRANFSKGFSEGFNDAYNGKKKVDAKSD